MIKVSEMINERAGKYQKTTQDPFSQYCQITRWNLYNIRYMDDTSMANSKRKEKELIEKQIKEEKKKN